MFARWSERPSAGPTEWWHVVCDRFDAPDLSSNTRSEVNRGLRRNAVRRIEAERLARHGYACYADSFARYRGTHPTSESDFVREMDQLADAPVEG